MCVRDAKVCLSGSMSRSCEGRSHGPAVLDLGNNDFGGKVAPSRLEYRGKATQDPRRHALPKIGLEELSTCSQIIPPPSPPELGTDDD